MRYGAEWTPGIVLLAVVIVFPLAPAFAMIALLIVALAVLAAVVALAGVVLASPFLIARALRERHAKLQQSTAREIEIHGAATEMPGLRAPLSGPQLG